MELTNTFEVPRSVDEAWPLLLDVERIAPCLPGAELSEIVGDEYRGTVKVKIGPVAASYRGAATFLERDEEARRVVISGKGRDTRGAGSAEAVVSAVLEPVDGGTTRVRVDTDLQIKGKVAQFGRGMMAEVSANLMDQFADNLATLLRSEAAVTARGERDADNDAASGVAAPVDPGDDAVDLLAATAGPLLKRVGPVIAALVVVWILRRVGQRRGAAT